MRQVTASEASRNFSALLDSVEQGETVMVTRGGRRIATITPAPAANGAAFNNVIAKWRGSEALDDAFSESMAGARAAASTEKDADPWND